MRAAVSVPIDLYVEAPDALGGVVRGHEAADLVAVAAPMYVKFGCATRAASEQMESFAETSCRRGRAMEHRQGDDDAEHRGLGLGGRRRQHGTSLRGAHRAPARRTRGRARPGGRVGYRRRT